MLSDSYGEATISERKYREWFKRFKSGGKAKGFDDEELKVLLNED